MEYRKILYQGKVKLVPGDIAEHLVISNQAKYAPAEPVDIIIDTKKSTEDIIESVDNETSSISPSIVDESIDTTEMIVDSNTNKDDDVINEDDIEIKPKKRGRQPKK